MFNKYIDHHKEPVCFWLHVIGFLIGIWALWNHNWTWIIIAVVVMLLGHLFAAMKKPKIERESVKEESSSTEQL
jgi:hypothetical protein